MNMSGFSCLRQRISLLISQIIDAFILNFLPDIERRLVKARPLKREKLTKASGSVSLQASTFP